MHVRAQREARIPRPPADLVGRLRMLIVDGVLPPREPIGLARVADLLDTGTDEALQVLMELGRDGFLQRVDEDTIQVVPGAPSYHDEILQIRRLVEPRAMRAAAGEVRPVDLITLAELAADVEEAVADRDFRAFRRADDAFAGALVALHPNRELARLCADLRARTAYEGLRVPVELGLLGEALRPHAQVVACIKEGDLDRVEALGRDLLDRLAFVGSPRMDDPHLAGVPIALEPEVDVEFLDADLEV